MSAGRRLEPYLLAAIYCAVPLATLVADNADLVRLPDVLPYYVVTLAAACAAIGSGALRGGAELESRTAVCVAVAVLLLFDYHELRPLLGSLTHGSRPSMVFLWAVLVGLAVAGAARLARRVPAIPHIALAAGLVMLASPLVRYADARGDFGERPATRSPATPAAGRLKARAHPRSVYFFLLDAYARPDRMRQQFGFDDSRFVGALREHGFVIPARSRSNYPITLFSIPSILTMDYRDDPAQAGAAMAGHNRVVSTFRRLGYEFGLAPDDLAGWDCKGLEDICVPAVETYASRADVSDLGWAVLERTPAVDAMQAVDPAEVSNFAAKRQFPLRVAQRVIAATRARPIFVFAHSLLTHQPYVYQGATCRLQRGEPKAAADYIGAVQCANANTLAAVRVIERADPRAIVVIASDHGTEVGSALAAVRPGTLDARRRLSNFVALRLPPACRDDVPRDLAAVNIFRVVVNCMTTARLRLLPYRAVLS